MNSDGLGYSEAAELVSSSSGCFLLSGCSAFLDTKIEIGYKGGGVTKQSMSVDGVNILCQILSIP